MSSNETTPHLFRCVLYVTKIALIMLFFVPSFAFAITVTTTIAVSICNNGIPDSGEVCDDGAGNNTGAYSSTTAGRRCSADCRSFGPYCGDGILMPLYSEQCDDGNTNNGDFCTDHCQLEATSTTVNPNNGGSYGGGGGGGGLPSGFIPALQQTRVSILGKGYPNTSVNILKDGQVLGVVQTDSNADFSFDSGQLTPGATTFGFWSTDAKGLRSITFTTTFQVTQNAVTTVSNVYLPPTIDLTTKKASLGEIINSFGSSAPNARILLYVNKETKPAVIGTTTASGAWSLGVATDGLANESFHTVKAMFETIGAGAQAKSGYSQLMSFYIGEKDVKTPGSADLNNDGKVNLVDFSILLFHWNTDHAVADLNSDSKVNLTDFSILLFNWTG
jgi:cysteine-rich repeat protein